MYIQTLKKASRELCKPLPRRRISLGNGLQFVTKPIFPGLDVKESKESGTQPTISLVFNIKEDKWRIIEFDETLYLDLIPNVAVPLYLAISEPESLYIVLNIWMQKKSKLSIIRDGQKHVIITLLCGVFITSLRCTLEDVAGFAEVEKKRKR